MTSARVIAASVGLAGMAMLAWWSLRTLPTVQPDSHLPSSPTSAQSPVPSALRSSPLSLDLAAFRAPLWVAPPAPPPPPTPAPAPPPRPPLKWQLLAVSRDDAGDYALMYDPDTDRLLRVRAGQSLGDRTVEEVLPSAVHIRDGTSGPLTTLALRDDKTGGKP